MSVSKSQEVSAKDNILYPTYSADLYTDAPEGGSEFVSTNSAKMFSWKGGKIFFVMSVCLSVGMFERQRTIELKPVSHYEIEMVIGAPSRSDVRELLLPKLQETVDPELVFLEFQEQVKTLIDARTNNTDLEIDRSGALDESGKAVSFEDSLKSWPVVPAPNAPLDKPSSVIYRLDAKSISKANTWISQLLTTAERNAAEVLVARAQGLLDKQLSQIKNKFADERLLERRELSRELATLKSDLDLATVLGIANPVQSAHPMVPQEDGVRYQEGSVALQRKYKKLLARLDETGSVHQSGDEKLLAELEVFSGIKLEQEYVITADLNQQFRSKEIIQNIDVLGPTLLGAFKGLFLGWIILQLLKFAPFLGKLIRKTARTPH